MTIAPVAPRKAGPAQASAGAAPRGVPTGAPVRPQAQRVRHVWVDVARGFVVVMVVLMHVGIYHFLPMTQGDTPNAFWTGVSNILQILRMPSLLILSGWLAGSRIRAGLASPRTRRSIYANAYLYALWLAIYVGVAAALGAATMAQAPTADTYLGQLLLPYSTLWFLAALAWYTTVLAALRRLPTPLVLAGLFALGWATTAIWPVEVGLWANIPHMAIYFALGVHARPAVEAIGRHPLTTALAGIVVATLAGEIAAEFAAGGLPTYPLVVVQSLAGVATVFGTASLAARYAEPLTRPMAWIGRRTLSVYALHYLAIMAVSTVASGPLYDLDRRLLASETGRWAYPVVATGVIVLVAVTVKEVADRIGLRALFAMPHRPGFLVRATAAGAARLTSAANVVTWDLARVRTAWRPRIPVRVPDVVDFAEFDDTFAGRRLSRVG